jgi:hypothetical protein
MAKLLSLVLATAAALALAQAAPARTVPRPVYPHPAADVVGPYVVLHYTKRGPDAPRLTDDDHDRIPNYVEKAAAAANEAWLYYGHNGFKAPLPDRGGGGPQVDVYVASLPTGLLGVTIPASESPDGAYMVVSNRLTMAHLARQGSLQQTVAHELFHLFQLAYVPSGRLPAWAREGSATAMETYVYPQIADPARIDYVDHWLDQPWRSLYDERGYCDHCYGGALWWRFVFHLGNHVLPEYFGRLHGYAKTARRIGDGTQPLDEIIARRTHGRENLFTAFTRFSVDLYRAGYRPAPLARLRATPVRQETARRVVRGLSTHYLPISVPPGARGLAVTVAAGGGPSPDVKVIVGGPKGRNVPRARRDGGREQSFRTRFATDSEARNAMLIVTSGRREGAAYTVSYRTL